MIFKVLTAVLQRIGVCYNVMLSEGSALNSRALFGYPDWGFPWFSSVVRQMPGYNDVKSGHGPRSPPQALRPHLSAWHRLLLRRSQSGLGPQAANQPKFIPPITSLCHIGTSLRKILINALSHTSKSLALAHFPVRVQVSVIEPSNAVKRRYG
jgi:hypothetical protein